MKLTCFVDFLCPWAYQALLWLRQVRQAMQSYEQCTVCWRFFSLEEHNRFYGDGWHIWQDMYPSPRSKGLLPFLVGALAETHEPDALERFFLHAGKLWHDEKQPLWYLSTLLEAARQAGLNAHLIEEQLANDQYRLPLLERIRCDHEEARTLYNVSGTPTLLLPDGRAVYLGIMPCPPLEQALPIFEAVRTLVERCDSVFELKHPCTLREEEAIMERVAHVRQAMFAEQTR